MSYHIPDEPQPGALARVAVNPVWPLFAIMVAGTWLSWPWFVLNGYAVGSPYRRREVALAATGFLGSLGMTYALWHLYSVRILTEQSLPYAALVLLVWKIGISYALHLWQGRSFALYEYYGGKVDGRLPFVLIALGMYLRPQVLGLRGDDLLWVFVLG